VLRMNIVQDIPVELVRDRVEQLQRVLRQNGHAAALITQNVNLYYWCGSMQTGYLFVPASGEATFYVRRSVARARQETALRVEELGSFRQFGLKLLADYPALKTAKEQPVIAADLDTLPAQLFLKLAELAREAFSGQLADGSAQLRKLRMVKSAWELERIDNAAKAAAAALDAALPELREGVSELAWMARVEYELRSRGHIGLMRLRGYNQEIATGMVISGASAAVPSYFDGPAGGLGLGAASPQSVSRSVIRRNEPILLDIGCCIDGYVIDQTRTAVIGSLPEQLARAYEVSVDVLRAAESAMAPGASCSSLYADALAQCAAAGLSDYFMGYGADQARFLGHGIGLEIDEWPVLAKGFDMPLELGMTIAVEPKFTFPGLGVVGIENSYVITAQGAKAITYTKEELIVLP
jgi:Xaa-Pro dipeptidase